MNVVKNLMFQRKFYPNIYEGYLQFYIDDEDYISDEYQEEIRNNEILIVTENFSKILEKVFVIPKEILNEKLNNLEEFEEIEIYKSYDENLKVTVNNSSIEIHCMYLYAFTNQVIRLVKNTNKQYFKDSSMVYMMREPSLYEKVYLQENSSNLIFINSEEELLNNMATVNLTYNENALIKKLESDNNDNLRGKINFGESCYKVSLSLDLIRNIIDMNLINEDLAIINQYIFKFIMDEFGIESRKIMDSYITKDFVNNFIIVDRFLSEGEKLSKIIINMIRGEIGKEFIEFKNLNRTSDLYVSLLGSSIKKLDGVLSHSLNELHKSINII